MNSNIRNAMVALSPASFGPRQAQPMSNYMADAKSIVEDLFGKADPNDLPASARAAIEHTARIRSIAARLFGPNTEGEELLEHLCDAMLRRPFVLSQLPRDQAMAYGFKREGQADAIYYLLALVAEGRSEQPPSREGDTHAAVPSSKRRSRQAPVHHGGGRRGRRR